MRHAALSDARRILIAVPAYSGEVNSHAMLSMMRAIEEGRERGWRVDVAVRPGDSLLTRCRNALLTQFWGGGYDDLLFWDADIATVPGAFARLMDHPVDLVAGLYPARAEPERYIFRALPGAEPDPDTGLTEAEAVPTGFLRVARAAVASMIAADPDAWINDRALGRLIWLFDFERRGGEYWSEDFVFCRRHRAAGGRVWVDSVIPFHHTGPKTFSGRHADFERRRVAALTTAEELLAEQAALDAIPLPLF